jgi:cell division septum initiation protein DivIVA
MDLVTAELQQTVERMSGIKAENFECKEQIKSLESQITQRSMDGDNIKIALDRAIALRKEVEVELADMLSAYNLQEQQTEANVLVSTCTLIVL